MRRPWIKQPRQLSNDSRYVLLSVEGALAYHLACLHADDDGTFWAVGARDVLTTLAELLGRRRTSGDSAWAINAAEECARVGLLEVSADRTVARVVEWVEDAPGAAMDGRGRVLSADERAGGASTAKMKRGPGRPCKGEVPMSASERKRRSRFDAREGGYRDVPSSFTWEQWEAREAVTISSDGRLESPPRIVSAARNPAAELRRETLLVGRASPGEIEDETENSADREEEGELGAAAPAAAKPRRDTPSVVRCLAIDGTGPFDAAAVLAEMQTASGGRLSTIHTASTAAAFEALARDLISRGHTTIEGLVRAARHAGHQEWILKRAEPIRLDRLLYMDGELLVELVSRSQTCAVCGGVPLLPVGSDAPNEDDVAIEAAEHAYRNGQNCGDAR